MSKPIYVVRHGQTHENTKRIMQGEMDTLLDEVGISQAYDLIPLIPYDEIDMIICSPKKRTMETARIVSDGKIPIIYDERLKSRNHGEFEGHPRYDVNLEEYWNYNLNKQYEKAESIHHLFDRVDSLLKEIKEEYPDKTILLVTQWDL